MSYLDNLISIQNALMGKVVATCGSCGRTFSCNSAYVGAVQAGKLESLCGYCDRSHDEQEG